ncbi:hypothetical protein [Pseudomonas putida]|uniref:hypothetical protein n=1 Tax=Pseudomonas putida TaxID=303 RepID=UPI003F8A4A32
MGKRKIFTKTDLSVPQVEHNVDMEGNVTITPGFYPPKNTVIQFDRNVTCRRSFDFSPWYGNKIDSITYTCQRQIERYVAGQDRILSISTVAGYCTNGLRLFLSYCILHATAIERDLSLVDLDRNLIDGFLNYLNSGQFGIQSQRGYYSDIKSVLHSIGMRGLFPLILSGDDATFPRNPFSHNDRKETGETSLSRHERQEFIIALRKAIAPIWVDATPITSELLAYALMVVALHTGRNTTPLLEMDRNCLRKHPKEDKVFLVLWKRRGYSTSRVALHSDSDIKSVFEYTPTVRVSIERLINRVISITESFNAEAPEDIKGRVWLYRSRARGAWSGKVTALTGQVVKTAINKLVEEYALKDCEGKPLRINISRLRKTFANRVFELANGDILTTAAALGNTARVTDQNYLAPGENARRNWRFMGEIMVKELLTATIGATYKTPLGNCTDPLNGQYAPKRDGATCINFLNCLRCKHYAVTADDLHKLFSFYFRLLTERSRIEKRRWAREYGHIPRLIEHYIVKEGIRRGTFKAEIVDAAREQARTQPHPFWSVDLIDSLEIFS